jgi:hypothetical protein
MRFSEETTSDGVTERLFTLGDVPGVVWVAEGSADKTLHASPGRHGEVPPFEVDSSERFFLRHLSA